MKKMFIPAAAFAFLLISCNNDKKVTVSNKQADGSVVTTSFDANEMEKASDEMDKRMEYLKNLKPLSVDELKGMLPEELNGLKRSDFSVNSAMGFAVAQAAYRDEGNKEFEVMIYDCAGEAGSGMYGMNYWAKMSMESESETEYTKTIDFMGGRAVENFHKTNNQGSLTYVSGDRFLVVVNGRDVGMDAIKQAAQSLKLKG